MPNLDDMIAVATRHLEEGRRIVERQREMIAAGVNLDGYRLLKTFEQSLAIFEADLARLLEEQRENEMPLDAMQAASLDESRST